MRIGIYGAALAAIQHEKNLTVIANNVANVNTPAFKKDGIHFSNFMVQRTYTKMDHGNLRRTGNPLDVALAGEGYFCVQTNEGMLHTRAGNWRLDGDRKLVTQEGWPVLGNDGQPIQFDEPEDTSEIRIERDGQIFDGEDLVGTLKISHFEENASLQKTANGHFKPVRGLEQLMTADQYQIEQGALEESNFNIVEEMAHMIESTRMFEAYQKILQSCDQQDSQLIKSLGNL